VARLSLVVLMLAVATPVFSADPQCDGPDDWAAMSTYGILKNAGLVDNYTTDFKKTKVTRIASQRIGKDLYRQVHDIVFVAKSGQTLVEVITVNDASHEECSMTGVEVYVVGKHFPASQ
jgi:hypothetical protein